MSYGGVDLDVRAAIKHYAACGFDDPQRVYERVVDAYADADEAEIDRLVDQAFAERDAAASAWPAVTDCDRLDRAFAALDAAGVVARHNFACCQSCGVYEIQDEIAGAREAHRRIDGYVFYHMQDTDGAVEHGRLDLRYGGTAGVAAAAIGERVVTALRAAGLTPEWNGDPGRTIEVALVWQRRAAPVAVPPRYTAADCVARWCDALPAATLSDAAALAGEDFPSVLAAAGLSAAALAWARAPYDAGDRAVALARLATATASSELLVEAWQLAPWDDRGTFTSLIVEAGLADPRVRAIAWDKIAESRRDARGGAAAAWFAACVPGFAPARERALAQWQYQREHDPEDGLLALAAGLWRAGEDLEVDVLAWFSRAHDVWAQRAAIAAAPTAGDVLLLADALEGTLHATALRRCACARLVELGARDVAYAYAAELGVAYEAYVAWRAGDASRSEVIGAAADDHARHHQDGVIPDDEFAILRLALVAATARHTDRARAHARRVADQVPGDRQIPGGSRGGGPGWAQLAVHAGEARATVLAAGRADALAHLAARPLAVERGSIDDDADRTTLAAAIENWSRDMPYRKRFSARGDGRTILARAAMHARRGELDRARELRDIAFAPLAAARNAPREAEPELDDAIHLAGLADAAVELWVAFGELDAVRQFTTGAHGAERPLSNRALGIYIPALVAAGLTDEAQARLGAALAAPLITRRALIELLPAVRAVAGGEAERLHAAWRAADQALEALAIIDALTAPT